MKSVIPYFMNSLFFTVQTECSMTTDSGSEDKSTSIRKFTMYFQEVIADHIIETQREQKIGSVGLDVEINEGT